jgi:hypothetical protein
VHGGGRAGHAVGKAASIERLDTELNALQQSACSAYVCTLGFFLSCACNKIGWFKL